MLLIILFHGAVNTWPQLLGGSANEVILAWAQTALSVLAAVVVVARYGRDLRAPLAPNG